MIRLVLDTNILISALLNPSGAPAQVLMLCLADADIQLCVSALIYAEYDEVIRRPRFKRSKDEIDLILAAIRDNSVWIRPRNVVRVCLDHDDDIFLECAQEAGANYIVTGNSKHFPAVWKQTRIVSAREFIDQFA